MVASSTALNAPVNGDFESFAGEMPADILTRRLRRRRQTLALAAASHLVNGALLLLFAAAGTVQPWTVSAYVLCSLTSVLVFVAFSESGWADRQRDHFAAIPYTTVTFVLQVVFLYLAPEAAVVFLCAILLVGSTMALRIDAGPGLAAWTVMTVTIAAVFVLGELPLSIPAATPLERVATLATFAATVGRCMYINIFSSRLRDDLYRRSVELEAAYQRIEELAELDELTGAYNRGCIMRLLEDEIERTRRSGATCSIALIDLDWFKRINDNFGHPIGDEVLRTFAITIFANIRSADRFGRYGGEEFLLILPDTSPQDASRILDRLRYIVQNLDWSALAGGVTVTTSAGIATLGDGDTADTLLARADRGLYLAKQRGRNRVASA